MAKHLKLRWSSLILRLLSAVLATSMPPETWFVSIFRTGSELCVSLIFWLRKQSRKLTWANKWRKKRKATGIYRETGDRNTAEASTSVEERGSMVHRDNSGRKTNPVRARINDSKVIIRQLSPLAPHNKYTHSRPLTLTHFPPSSSSSSSSSPLLTPAPLVHRAAALLPPAPLAG